MIYCLIAVFAFCGTGCATLIHGTTQKIKVSSEPSDAAVQVDGKAAGNTPVKLKLKTHEDHVLVFTKDGYKEEKVTLARAISSVTCCNIFMWGIVGWAVDGLTGSQYRLVPDKVHVEMKKAEAGLDEGEKGKGVEQ